MQTKEYFGIITRVSGPPKGRGEGVERFLTVSPTSLSEKPDTQARLTIASVV